MRDIPSLLIGVSISWLCWIMIVESKGILQPRPNVIREILSLDGLWNFAPNNITVSPSSRQVNVDKDVNLMPVPASYNDIGTQKGLRDYAGAVTYTRIFFIPKSWGQKRIWIRFGSVCYSAYVTINGQPVVEHSIGHLPFGAEVTSVVNIGYENNITVVVDNILTESTIPQGGLSQLEKITYILATVHYDVSILDGDSDISFNILILDHSGKAVASESNQAAAGRLNILNANLWWPYTMDENPGYLYTFRVNVFQGNVLIDRYDQPFGIRELTWDSITFKINGVPLYLRGFGRHEDSDFRGKGTDLPLFIKDHNLIRWLGANSYRTSHYPYCEELMDLADQLGLMIIDEVPSVNTALFGDALLENHKRSFSELHNRDKNRPSVVAWSCANEPMTQYNQSSAYFQEVVAHIKFLDTSRPVTAAVAQDPEVDNIGQHLDIIGFNRYEAWYENTADLEGITPRIIEEAEKWHAKYQKPIFCTEYGADTLEGLHILPTFIWTEEFQQTLMSRYFQAFDTLRQQNEWFIGEHIWNFADFKTSETYVRVGGNKKGIFTRNRQPKSSAFLLRRRYWALAKTLDGEELPSDLENYVEANYVRKDEL